ncbi:hypothetical protein AWH69_04975 [Janibacter melonis]|uniref:Uncharacterized protein n=1 Tax=Janibacter melonis TaxID=262209 RepID=A0A176QCN9_9MICO|nr:hypothetical protein AWH69_04975 [Janibacter melonis]
MGMRVASRVVGCVAAVTVLAGCGGGAPAGPGGSSTPTSQPSSTSGATPDPTSDLVAPHDEENAAATRRQDPSPSDSSAASAALPTVRSALETQRSRGEIGVDETRATVLGLGYGEDDVEVIDIQEHLGDPAATPGVLVGVVTGPRTCLVGAVTKQRVTLEVDGTGPPGEYRCVAPVTH